MTALLHPPPAESIDWTAFSRDFERYHKDHSREWGLVACSVLGANHHDAADGLQQAILILWKMLKKHFQPGDTKVEDVLLRALQPKNPDKMPNPKGWMATVIRRKVTTVAKIMHRVRPPKKPNESQNKLSPAEAIEEEQSRRLNVQMKPEHLDLLAPTLPDTTAEHKEAQQAFAEKELRALSEEERELLNAKLDVEAGITTWAEVGRRAGETGDVLKKRASRLRLTLNKKLAKRGLTKMGDI